MMNHCVLIAWWGILWALWRGINAQPSHHTIATHLNDAVHKDSDVGLRDNKNALEVHVAVPILSCCA